MIRSYCAAQESFKITKITWSDFPWLTGYHLFIKRRSIFRPGLVPRLSTHTSEKLQATAESWQGYSLVPSTNNNRAWKQGKFHPHLYRQDLYFVCSYIENCEHAKWNNWVHTSRQSKSWHVSTELAFSILVCQVGEHQHWLADQFNFLHTHKNVKKQ